MINKSLVTVDATAMGSASILHLSPALAGKCDHCMARGPLDLTSTFAFQSNVDVAPREIVSYEALVR